MSEQNTIFNNMIWRFLERFGAKGVEFLVSLILARLLSPKVYGIIALITVFTTILNVLVDSGLGNALIQKKDADDVDFSTVFLFNICICVILYIMVFLSAPLIADFYNMPNLIPVIRVLSLTIIVSGIKNIQQAYVSRNMLFKRFFFSTLGGTLSAAIIGIWMACKGFGVWALVAQQLTNISIDTIILWITVKWRPKCDYSIDRLKKLFSYGWKLLVSALIDNVYNNLCQLIIGKKYSSSDLAFYNKGKQFPDLIVSNIVASIDSVLLPTMSRAQDTPEIVKNITRRAMKISTYIMAPLMLGMAFCAEPFIIVLLTDKWLQCVPFLRIFCITNMFYPVHTANLNAIKALGRSDLFLRLEIIKKLIGIALLFSTMWFGVKAMAYSFIVSCVLSQIINSWPNKKLLNYSYGEQLKDILPSIVLALIMGICVYPLIYIGLPTILALVIQIIAGAFIYWLGSSILQLDSYKFLIAVIKAYMPKRK